MTSLRLSFSLDQELDVEKISRSLDFIEAQRLDRFPCFSVSALLDVPSRRLGTHEDEEADDDGWEHGRGHHDSPVQAGDTWTIRHTVECQVGCEANHDAEGCKHLRR